MQKCTLPIMPPGPDRVITISSVRSPQFVAKPLSVICELEQAEAGTEQLTLLTHGGVLQPVEQVLLPGALVPHEFLATAETDHCVAGPGVHEKVNVVSNSATPPAGTLFRMWSWPLI